MSNLSFNKRQKEKNRQDKQRAKEAKRAQRRTEKDGRPAAAPGEDPDLIGIVPGPQPVAEDPDSEPAEPSTPTDPTA